MGWMGIVVKEKSSDHPKGFQASGRFQSMQAAADMKTLLEANAKKEGREAQYFVTELITGK